MTKIQWTDQVWNPTVGCSRASAGCENCYAERVAHRGMQDAHRGLTVMGSRGPRWTGEVRLLPERLAEPLRWRKPRRVFVDSMSDLFHPEVPFEFAAAVFGVMAATPRHTYQLLTKRPERMAEFFRWLRDDAWPDGPASQLAAFAAGELGDGSDSSRDSHFFALDGKANRDVWPLPNVWLGTSVENQATADERILHLLDCPAAVRWISAEPLLGPIDLRSLPFGPVEPRPRMLDALTAGSNSATPWHLDWVVVGGESGPGARACDVAWVRSIVAQCQAAEVPVFVKQLGARPVSGLGSDFPTARAGRGWDDGSAPPAAIHLRDRKGGDPAAWPEDLRVREWPGVRP